MLPIVWAVALHAGLFVSGYEWPSPQYDALETFLYEGRDLATNNISAISANCKVRGLPDSVVAAEWVRFAYHDSATHNINDGTGGLDGSVFYELDRDENIGAGMEHTARDFDHSADKYISRADIVALGVVWGVAACGGPVIPFRGGRTSAFGPGPLGVPDPTQDIATHTEKFRLQGFSATEMIALVACGHTLGAVRSADFPNLAPRNNSDASGVGLAPFDSTTGKYDSTVATEYISGTTKNPLVIASNSSFASDLRIFSSDGNATMNRLQSESEFAHTCSAMMAKMIDTVPASVTLTDKIDLLPAKVSSAYITVVKDKLIFETLLRLSQPDNLPDPTNRTVNLFWCDKRGDFKDCSGKINIGTNPALSTPPTSPVATALKTKFVGYQFAVPILANQSVSKFWFEVNDGTSSTPVVHDNGGKGYVFQQDEVIYVPWLTTKGVTPNVNGTLGNSFTIIAGIRSESKPTKAVLHAFDGSGATHLPYDVTVDLTPNTTISLVDGYSSYSAKANNSDRSLLNVDLEVVVDGVSYRFDYGQTTFIDKSVILDKPLSTVSLTHSRSSIPGSTTKNGSLPASHSPPLVGFVVALAAIMTLFC